MNRTLLIVTIAASSCLGTAFADDITIEAQPFHSTRTRAEVRAELKEFRASGVDPWADNYTQSLQPQAGRTRAEVQAELKAHRASGVDPWADNYTQSLAVQPGKTRAQVKAEYAAAKAAGELPDLR
ncbi:MAG: putative exported protein [Ramlibacter sp.]|jgi:hypothetical protein|nr:putative exported protein [Ramlibacter sp.]MDB5911941.1 putative exported protein [Ramlibacter sp.]